MTSQTKATNAYESETSLFGLDGPLIAMANASSQWDFLTNLMPEFTYIYSVRFALLLVYVILDVQSQSMSVQHLTHDTSAAG